MAGNALTTATTMTCPHGGSVKFASANTKATAQGAPILLVSDIGTVSGCPFTLPGPKPSPCVIVRWQLASADKKNTAGGQATVSQSTLGLCYSAEQAPQGPVLVLDTQKAVSTL